MWRVTRVHSGLIVQTYWIMIVLQMIGNRLVILLLCKAEWKILSFVHVKKFFVVSGFSKSCTSNVHVNKTGKEGRTGPNC